MERAASLPVAAAFLAVEALPHSASPNLPLSLRAALCRLACQESDLAETCSWGWDSPRTIERILHQLTTKLSWSGGLRWEFQPWCLVTDAESLVPPQADMAVVYIGQTIIAPSVYPVTVLEAKVREVRRRSFGGLAALTVLAASDLTSLAEKEKHVSHLLEHGSWEPVADSRLVSCRVLEHLQSALDEDAPSQADVLLEPAGEHVDECREEGDDNLPRWGPAEVAFLTKGRLHFTTGEAAKAREEASDSRRKRGPQAIAAAVWLVRVRPRGAAGARWLPTFATIRAMEERTPRSMRI